jgi:HD-like signal output (HDOD) protein/CheY-like chemotaxis protein
MNTGLADATTVLVVDDEAICREAVAEVLRSRGGHATICACSGVEALAALEETPVGLILLDVSMPEMDGLTMLRTLRSNPRHEQLPVILLTDHADVHIVREAASLRAAGYLLKSSFSADVLLERVRQALSRAETKAAPPPETTAAAPAPRGPSDAGAASESPPTSGAANSAPASSARGTLDYERVRKAVQGRIELRPVSPTLSELMKLTTSTESSVHEITDVVRRDGALALRLLKVANSNLYSTGRRAKTLDDAAARLGVSGIRNAVATIATAEEFGGDVGGGLVPQRMWEHALAVALIAQELALRIRPEVADDVYLAGLLHDVGRLTLHAAAPQEFNQAMAAAAEKHVADLAGYERDVFGLSHADVTRLALEARGLPRLTIDAAAMHEQPIEALRRPSPVGANALIVALANRVAHALALGDSGAPTLLAFDEHARALGLDIPKVIEIGRAAAKSLADMELGLRCFGDSEFLPPLASELSGAVSGRPRVRVVGPKATSHPVALFLGELGWMADNGTDAIVVVGGPDLSTARAAAEAAVASCGDPPAILFVDLADPSSLPEVPGAGACGHVALPIRYSSLIQTLVSMCDSQQPQRQAALAHGSP